MGPQPQPTQKQIVSNPEHEVIRKILLQIYSTFEKILKVKKNIDWKKGEAKASVIQDFDIDKLKHLDFPPEDQKVLDLVIQKIEVVKRFLSWSPHNTGWQANLQPAKISQRRLEILKVSLSFFLDIIDTIEPIAPKLYPFGSDFKDGQPAQYQKGFDIYLWDQVREILKLLKNNQAWSEDVEFKNILDFDLKKDLIQEVKATIFKWKSTKGFSVTRTDTRPTYIKNEGNILSLVARLRTESETTIHQFGAPVVMTVKIAPLENSTILNGTKIKKFEVRVTTVLRDGKYGGISFGVIVDNKYLDYLDGDFKLEGEAVYLNIENQLVALSGPLLTQLFGAEIYQVLDFKDSNKEELEFLGRSDGEISVLGVTLKPKFRQQINSFKSAQIPVFLELNEIHKGTQKARDNRNQQFKQPKQTPQNIITKPNLRKQIKI